MKFDERMMNHLKPLASKFLENEEFYYLSKIAEMMVGFSSGGWNKLGDDEREFYLVKLKGDFHVRGMGESTSCWNDADYNAINELIDAEYRALSRKKTNH